MSSTARAKFEKIIWILCALVASYQGLTILMSFIKTPYIVSSATNFPQTFDLPAVSICAHTRLFSEDYYRITNSTAPDGLRNRNVTFEQHYNESLMPHLIANCAMLLPNLTAANCSTISDIKIYVSKQFVCYTYFDRDYVKEVLNYNMKIVNGFIMFEMSLNSSATPDEVITLVVHSKSKRPNPFFSESGSLDINVNETSSVSILVNIQTILIQTAPSYVCSDYRKLNYRSYDDCLMRCKFNTALNATGLWPGELLGSNKSGPAFKELLVNMNHMEKESILHCLNEVCVAKDCKQRDYTTEIRNMVPTDPSGKDRSSLFISIGTPFVMETLIDYQEQITFNQVVSQLGGLFSLWTGVSVVLLFEWLYDAYGKIKVVVVQRKQQGLGGNIGQEAKMITRKGIGATEFAYGVASNRRIKVIRIAPRNGYEDELLGRIRKAKNLDAID